MHLVKYGLYVALNHPLQSALLPEAESDLSRRESVYVDRIRAVDETFQRIPELWDRMMRLPGHTEKLQSRFLLRLFQTRLWCWAAARGAQDLLPGSPIVEEERKLDDTTRSRLEFLGLAVNYDWLRRVREVFRAYRSELPWWLGPSLERASELVELRASQSLEELDKLLKIKRKSSS